LAIVEIYLINRNRFSFIDLAELSKLFVTREKAVRIVFGNLHDFGSKNSALVIEKSKI
jgi:hypothetical protein